MPHVSSGGGDDLGSTDEVKVYNDEGEEEKRSSENLSEDKLGLVTESEEGKPSDGSGENYTREKGPGSTDGKSDTAPDRPLPFPLISPYPYPNGATVPGLGHPGLASLYLYNNDRFASPPPAHMGIPPVHIDPKTGLPRSVYPLHPPPGQFPHPFYTDPWSPPGSYAAGLRGPYPPLAGSPLSRFSPPGLLPHHPGMPPGFPHHAIITPGPKQELLHGDNHRGHPHHHHHHLHGDHNENAEEICNKKKIPKIKKPLNAFMLFMKEMRAKVIEECALKESAAINQILGRRWHALDRSEQAKYYEMARKEKELHQQLYPGWSARDNYATHNKKKLKRKRENGMVDSPGSSVGNNECSEAKKCRARFGLDAQNQWCKPCRRKKKCIRAGGVDDGFSDSEPDGNLSCSLAGSHCGTTDGESLAGGSPMPPSVGSNTDENRNHHISSIFGPRSPVTTVLKPDPLHVKPLSEILHSPHHGLSALGSSHLSPARVTPPPSMLLSPARSLHLTSTPSSSHPLGLGNHLLSPRALHNSPAYKVEPRSPLAATHATGSSASSSLPPHHPTLTPSSSMLLAT